MGGVEVTIWELRQFIESHFTIAQLGILFVIAVVVDAFLHVRRRKRRDAKLNEVMDDIERKWNGN